jgi:mevalonate kinase
MEFYSSGKLMLTGEYVVLAGAKALSLPTKLGQKMTALPTDSNKIHWKSFDCNGNVWFENEFLITDITTSKVVDSGVETRLKKLLSFINQKTDLLKHGWFIETHLGFDRQWGLGSSSTLVANLAKWSKIDPIELLHAAFSGSGYDVATGMENDPILYQIKNDKPSWETTQFKPPFFHQIFFVYLGEKKHSEEEVKAFDLKTVSIQDVVLFNELTNDLLSCKTLPDFSYIMTSHEIELGRILKRSTIKYERFSDYPFTIKSLGAWGGDFIMAVGNPEDQNYFKNKGYHTILTWDEMIKD